MLVWAVYAVILDVYIEMTLTSAEKQRLVYFDPMGEISVKSLASYP